MSYVHKTETFARGVKLEIVADDDAENPQRMWDHLGTLETAHRRYAFGNADVSAERIEELIGKMKRGEVYGLLVFMYDHSGITISASRTGRNPFSCGWDSGLVGVIWCDHQTALDWFQLKRQKYRTRSGKVAERLPSTLRERALKAMEGDIETLDDYLRGNVWGFRVLDAKGDEVDSCWGFIGDPDEDVYQEGVAVAKHAVAAAERDSVEEHTMACRDIATIEQGVRQHG